MFGPKLLTRLDFGVLVILALPWVLIVTGFNWIFDYVVGRGYLDPWIYWGYFLNWPVFVKAFPDTYYGSRLSWIVPGYLTYRTFSPVVAAYVLHLGFYYTAVLSLYLTLKATVSHRTALLSALLMGCHGFFLWAVGWDYVDGTGIAYFLLTTLALTYAAKRQRSWVWLVFSGVAYGCLVHSQLFLVVFTPAFLLYYLALNHRQRRHPLPSSAMFFALGFLAVSSVFGMINHVLGGEFLFYKPSVRTAIELMGQPNPWRQPFQTWSNEATWLVIPGLVFVSSLVFLFVVWKRRSDCKIGSLIVYQLYFLVCALILLFFELRGSPVLQISYYASFLIPTTFLALGAQLAPVTERLSSRTFVFVVCGVTAMFLLVQRVPTDSRLAVWMSSHAPWLLAGLIAAGITIVFLRGNLARAAALSMVCLALALVSVVNGRSHMALPTKSREGFEAMFQSVQAIRKTESSGRVLFWYQLDEPMGNFYQSIASAYLWGYSLLNERFPSVERGPGGQLPGPDRRIVVLSSEDDGFQRAELALRQIGFGSQLVAEERIQVGTVGWTISFIEVEASVVEGIRFNSNAWPQEIQLRWGPQERRTVSISDLKGRILFRSEMDAVPDWEVNRYGRAGGLSIEPSCLATNDDCGLYSSGDPRDHLASPFAALQRPTSVFFSIWVKPRTVSERPKIVLQDENFASVVESQTLSVRGDGWILEGNWFDVRNSQQLRLVVTQQPGASSLLDKPLLFEVPSSSTVSAPTQ